jgi:septum formation protein
MVSSNPGPMKYPLILASKSPQRKRLLEAAAVDFNMMAPRVDEQSVMKGPGEQVALRRAMLKALDVAGRTAKDSVVLAVDTLIEMNQQQFGKPGDRVRARRMLLALSGREHQVISGVALVVQGGDILQQAVKTNVIFRELDTFDIDSYLNYGEGLDKAGGYGIQGKGMELIRDIEGDLTCVIGFPLACIRQLYIGLTGVDMFHRQSLKKITLTAFPGFQRISPRFLEGIPD